MKARFDDDDDDYTRGMESLKVKIRAEYITAICNGEDKMSLLCQM